MANEYDIIELLFEGMEKLGPGSEADTLHVLNLLPGRDFHLVVDAGCGSGRQTLTLAKALGVIIHAVDIYELFWTICLNVPVRRALSSLCRFTVWI